MGNLLIVNGDVIDGTGGPALRLDVRVRDGRIAEMAAGLAPDGEPVIDAAGAIVAPGFIDSHTHFDATVFWDPRCDPMPQHGVTSVVIGNCALSLAPVRPQDRAAQIDVYSYIEDLPVDVLNAAIPWKWETFGEYAQALSRQPLGINLIGFVGHSQIRAYIMGDAAWERAATPEEIAAMADELDKALAAGALGLSYSLFDKDRRGRLVPSCVADAAELDALFAVLAAHEAPFQFVPDGNTTETLLDQLEWLASFLERHGVVGLYNIVVHVDGEPDRSRRVMELLERLHARGVRLFGMVSPRPFELSIGFDQTIAFINIPAWNELVQAGADEKRRLVSSEEWRSRARADVDAFPSVMFPFAHPEPLRINAAVEGEPRRWIGRTLAELAAERGGHISDVLADWLRENDFATSFVFPIANTDEGVVARLLASPCTFVSGSDAGAHLQMFCAAGDTTLLLTRYVRDRRDLSLEEAVAAITGRQAELLGIKDRGVLAPGKAADITIFSLEELAYGAAYMVDDLPNGQSRLTRDPGGYRYTIVGGVVVQESGRATEALPGRWLKPRGGRS